MISKKISPKVLVNLIEPYDMEYKDIYISRFIANKDMKFLFKDNPSEAKVNAEKVWKENMLDATVTVRLLNGDEFFIY